MHGQLSSTRHLPEVVASSNSFSSTAFIADMSSSSSIDLHYSSSQPDTNFNAILLSGRRDSGTSTGDVFSPISPFVGNRSPRSTSLQGIPPSLSSTDTTEKDLLLATTRVRANSSTGVLPSVTPTHPISTKGCTSSSSATNTTSSSACYATSSISPVDDRNNASYAAFIKAKKENDSMIYIDGPQVYTCSHCRTHLTSHDDIISKSFHGRHGRAYLLDQCVNVVTGPEEKRRLMTGLHVVCDIFCKRCNGMVGWTYSKAYEPSQKYKEGKFIIEKINLHLEESAYYTISHPAGERDDRWRKRSMSWGSEHSSCSGSFGYNHQHDMVYEYRPSAGANNGKSPRRRATSIGGSSFDSPGASASSPYRRRTMSTVSTDSKNSKNGHHIHPMIPDLSPSSSSLGTRK